MALIDAKNLKKSFGTIKAVDNISLSLELGEVVGFLGPNGAGKSTTMKLLTGFLEPDSGSVNIKGIDLINESTKAKSQIGYLPEGAPAYSDMTVNAFLTFIGQMRGLKDDKLKEITKTKKIKKQLTDFEGVIKKCK